MQRLFRRAPVVYFVYLFLMTIATIVFLSLGYRFIVSSEIIWFVINVLAILVFAGLCLGNRKASTQSANIFAQALPLLALVYIGVSGSLIDGVSKGLLIIYAWFCFASCYAISLLCANKGLLKNVCIVLNSILLLFLLLASLFAMMFGQMRQDTIVLRVTSPDNSYTAILVDSDQGALGGDTLVDVEDHTSGIDIGWGRFTKVQRVYRGKWGEFETMTLQWENGHTLLINGEPYSVE